MEEQPATLDIPVAVWPDADPEEVAEAPCSFAVNSSEGDELADAQELAPSVFTSALVEGLETGEADRDQDGLVALDELYDYIHDRVRAATPNQTPGKWAFGVQGDLYIARRARPVTTPPPLPPELQQLIDHPLARARAGAVQELARLLESRHAGLALAGRLALERLTEGDSRSVSAAATAALAAQAQPVPPEPLPPPEPVPPEPLPPPEPVPPEPLPPPEPVPPEPLPPRLELSATVVDFGRLPQHSQSPEPRVRLANAGGGTRNARAATQATWLALRQVGDELAISVDTTAAGEHHGIVTIGSDGGLGTIRVTGTVEPRPTLAPNRLPWRPPSHPPPGRRAQVASSNLRRRQPHSQRRPHRPGANDASAVRQKSTATPTATTRATSSLPGGNGWARA